MMVAMKLKRRDFLRIVGIGSVAGLTAYALDRSQQPVYAEVTETRILMGTVVNLTLITANEQAGRAAITACLDHMVVLERILSRHRDDSELTRLNRDGRLDSPSEHLVRVLCEAQHIAEVTEGAFDVTVKPLIDLYQARFREDRGLPESDRVAAVMENVGFRYLDIQANRVAFARPHMGITLDGIAKGYIVDEGVAQLKQYGFENILVEAGGDLVASGEKAQRHPWQIGIQPPRQTGNGMIHAFSVRNQAVATSGDYQQAYSADLAAYHIVDPRTGWSAPELASATVVGSGAMLADALATALMVMGSERGLALVESIVGCEAYLVTKDLSIRRSAGFVSMS